MTKSVRKLVAEGDDVEGHLHRGAIRAAEGDEDVEGHLHRGAIRAAEGDEDVEGHIALR